ASRSRTPRRPCTTRSTSRRSPCGGRRRDPGSADRCRPSPTRAPARAAGPAGAAAIDAPPTPPTGSRGRRRGSPSSASCDPHEAALDEARVLDPALVGIIRDDGAPALDLIDHATAHARRHRGTTPAPAETAERTDGAVAHVGGAVHDDPSLHREIVHARLE